ncbi:MULTISPECIES: hypothetical protein [Pseudomonas]|uniref:hypothetical protein n=1 Tax=Pseudomonas TaxID=286 RepID=UPI000761743E|nr:MULTISPECIES: hypothetical protein [Pseudomonas]MDG9809446.1 hypothetical protein [Pseudomonas juntendi]MDG9815803.1 hypothetical protein [Pseudomonas putida]
MIEVSRFYKEVRKFCQQEPTYSPRRQVVRTLPSDRWDLSRVARRVYKDATEVLTIMAAAGLPNVDAELVEQDLVLPTIEHLHLLKQRAGLIANVRTVR